MMSDDDNDGQMIFGDLGGLKFPDICLTGEEIPRKNSPRKLVPTGNRTRDKRACYHLLHSGGHISESTRSIQFKFCILTLLYGIEYTIEKS